MEKFEDMPLSTLMALRDLGRDDLRRAKDQVEELNEKLLAIGLEIEQRGKSKPE